MNAIVESFEYWLQGGWLLIPLAMICVCIWYYLLKMNRQLDFFKPTSPSGEERLENQLAYQVGWQELQMEIRHSTGTFNQIIAYVIEKLQQGIDLFEIFAEVRHKTFAPFTRDLVVLSALVTSAPLLGLLGTVFGMIETFQAVAERSHETTELMAAGISQGLITTQFGLIIAIPGIFGIIILRKKIQQLDVRLSGLQNHFILGLRRRNQ